MPLSSSSTVSVAFDAFQGRLRADMREELNVGLTELRRVGMASADLIREGYEEETARWLVQYRRVVVSSLFVRIVPDV
jgi:hypothetical protein